MRRLAAGTVTYTYENLSSAQKEIQDQPVWVAPNSLYRREEIFFSDDTQERKSIVYVGRFEPAKKVHLLVRGFHKSRLFENGVRLVLVGDGSQREALENEVANLGLREHVEFRGWRTDVAEIRETYADAFTSVSPGFIGLGLTQSLGFGVPMVAALDEPHSPEVELAKTGGVSWFPTDDEAGLGEALQRAWGRRSHVPDATLQSTVKSRYSAEAMAEGLVSALLNRRVVSVDPKIQREGATNNDQ